MKKFYSLKGNQPNEVTYNISSQSFSAEQSNISKIPLREFREVK